MPLTTQQKQKLFSLIEPLIESMGLELVDLKLFAENKRQTFQVTLDKEGGVSLDDCSKASQEISRLMDVEEFFSFEYNLEVSSPGIFRELTRPKDFVRFQGQRIKGKLQEAFEGEYTLVGTLVELTSANELVLETDHGRLSLPLSQFKIVQLHPQL